jgi:hypothetical protein
MLKSIQSIIVAGVITWVGLGNTTANAQRIIDWKNPDMPYIEQRGFSLGTNFGVADMWGDVGTTNPIDHYNNKTYKDDIGDNIRFMGGLFVRYTHVPGLSFRLGVNYGSLYATDNWNEEKALKASNIKDDYFQRYVRNLDAKTNIWEGNFLIELSPLRLIGNWEFSNMAKWRCQPYLLGGFSGFYFNPRGTHLDLNSGIKKDVDLQPLRTEGQGFNAPGETFPASYSLFSYAAVAGAGIKFDIGKGLGLGLEYQMRFTFTDYLDDVSGRYIDPLYQQTAFLNQGYKANQSNQMSDKSREIIPGYQNAAGSFRGNPTDNDKFSTLSIMFFWKIKKRANPWWSTYN